MVDYHSVLERIKKCERIPEKELRSLLWSVLELVSEEPNVLSLQAPINICGDIHGQYYDLRYLFEIAGHIPTQRYLFLGDYVDRGYYSIETITFLLCLKVCYPDHIYLLRGNHESRSITQTYGFFDECLLKYGHSGLYKLFMDVFDYLPIAACVDQRYYCVHGGLSPSLPTLDDVHTLMRACEIPSEGPFSDMVWSDPSDILQLWQTSSRGAGYIFGREATKRFLLINDLAMVVRAHQIAVAGHDWRFDGLLCTMWSAPKYCYRSKNSASVMHVRHDEQPTMTTFEAVPDADRVLPPRSWIVGYGFNSLGGID
ncbi:hypothetical protein KIPB_002478 [Kipferlia bialata]|uniref:Serine/threonine-protein phosphatase n=1 Tax=Kipferlia bialata TaxID=797122 RepID=A0A9K3CRH7_9EUKA|nr:hypothetical protein KIPB_002478 [Kipferlia bialata]|eukprot:g2478.t1